MSTKVKAVDIAKKLGISKATVSLALNGKPGVNEATREKVLQCKQELEEERQRQLTALPEAIAVLIVNNTKNVLCGAEPDLWSGVLTSCLSAYEAEAERHGFAVSVYYLNAAEHNRDQILEQLKQPQIVGVVVVATEFTDKDHDWVSKIEKPVVLYDYEIPGENYNSVCLDNPTCVDMACEALLKKGCKKIKYIAVSQDIFNFTERRKEFQRYMMDHDIPVMKTDILRMGATINEVRKNIQQYFENHEVPDGLVLENYQISIGVLQGAAQAGIRIPEQLKLVGIDEVPSYSLGGVSLVQIGTPHRERAVVAIDLLCKEIDNQWRIHNRVLSLPYFINGDSI